MFKYYLVSFVACAFLLASNVADAAKNLPQDVVKPQTKLSMAEKVRLYKEQEEQQAKLQQKKLEAQKRTGGLQLPAKLVVKKESKRLEKGITYTFYQDVVNGKQIEGSYVEVSPKANYKLWPFSVAGMYNGLDRLSYAVKSKNMPAAINASYFDASKQMRGWVIGNVKLGENLMAVDYTPRSALAQVDGKLRFIKDVVYKAQLRMPNKKTVDIGGMNRARIADDLVIYNSFFAPSTRTNKWGREVKVKDGRVVEISTAGNMKIESNVYVLSGHGKRATALASLRVGDKVELEETLGSKEADSAEMLISGGPLLLEKGKVKVRTQEEYIARDIAVGRAPRTAVALKADGSLILFVVDGRSQRSVGLTLEELAQYLAKLGAVDALNFDGGGSTEMVVRGKVVNNPSDGRERPVAIGLGLVRK